MKQYSGSFLKDIFVLLVIIYMGEKIQRRKLGIKMGVRFGVKQHLTAFNKAIGFISASIEQVHSRRDKTVS